MTEPVPGFYLKYIVCDEHGNSIVHSNPVRILTAREFYDQRYIPSHVANTYESFAAFMSLASVGVNLIDTITTFSRCNYVAPKLRWQVNAVGQITAELCAVLKNELHKTMDEEVLTALGHVLDKPTVPEDPSS